MSSGHLPHPAVLRILHRNPAPGMIFVLWIVAIESGFTAQILHSDILNSARPGISFNLPAPESSLERGRNGSIEFQNIVLDTSDNAIPNNIPASGLPDQPPISGPTSHVFHSQPLNPRLSAGPCHRNRITRAQSRAALDTKAFRAHGDIVV